MESGQADRPEISTQDKGDPRNSDSPECLPAERAIQKRNLCAEVVEAKMAAVQQSNDACIHSREVNLVDAT
jgi:hypothetical protein